MVLAFLTEGWTRFFSPPPKRACLDSLPSDVIIDLIFPHLIVEEIIAMRRVRLLT
jgi:hypothetical protein